MEPLPSPEALASELDSALSSLPNANTASMRRVRRRFSMRIKPADAKYVLELARRLLPRFGRRWIAYEILHDHPAAFRSLGEKEIEEFGRGIDSWWTVDSFARTLSGPAWLNGQLSDALITRWARSGDPWRRRAALVSTVALNVRSQGGPGDVPRTLAVCRLLVDDHEDTIVKAMSWALRALGERHPEAVRSFLRDHESRLAKRVWREVKNKLDTGLKTPKRNKS